MLTRCVRSASRLTPTQARGVVYSNGQPYDKRWANHFNFAYFTDPQNDDPVGRPKPEDSLPHGAWLGSFRSYLHRRFTNVLRLPYARRHRFYNPFDLWFLPLSSMFLLQFAPMGVGFKIFAAIPLVTMFCRLKDRSADPILEETYLRDMIHNNPQLKKVFNVDTMTTLDYDFDWIKGFPSAEEFPEFQNRLFRFFNADTNMCKGHFVFADVASKATMRVEFETMPVRGDFRYQMSNAYFMFDVVADVNHNGVHERVVLVDRKETLKQVRPFLLML